MWDLKVVHIIFAVIPLTIQAPVGVPSKPIVWVYGAPGAGKSSSRYSFTRLSTGELLRAEVERGSARAKTLASIMKRGELVPNEVVLELLKKAMEANAACSDGFVIDGFPRDVSQAEAFEKAIGSPDVILYFEAPRDTLLKRLRERATKSGRLDDNEETIQLRLKIFFENNDKILAKYPNMVRINTDRPMNETYADVKKALDKIYNRHTFNSKTCTSM